MEDISDIKIAYRFIKRRDDDIGTIYANSDTMLKWSEKLTLRNMCEDAWNLKRKNITVIGLHKTCKKND